MIAPYASFSVISADGNLVSSGQSVIVYGMNIVSGGGGGGVVILRDGTAVGSTATIQENGDVSAGKTIMYDSGVVYPNGCFVDVDANVTQVTMFYQNYRG